MKNYKIKKEHIKKLNAYLKRENGRHKDNRPNKRN